MKVLVFMSLILALGACGTAPENAPPSPLKKVPASSPAPNPVRSFKIPKPQDTPTVPDFPDTDEVYYRSCKELRKDHPRGVRKGAEGYRAGLDRDHDGMACEP